MSRAAEQLVSEKTDDYDNDNDNDPMLYWKIPCYARKSLEGSLMVSCFVYKFESIRILRSEYPNTIWNLVYTSTRATARMHVDDVQYTFINVHACK